MIYHCLGFQIVAALLRRLRRPRPGDKAVRTQEYGNDATIGGPRVVSSAVDSPEALAMSMMRAMWLLMKATEEVDQGSRCVGRRGTVHLTESVVVLFDL